METYPDVDLEGADDIAESSDVMVGAGEAGQRLDVFLSARLGSSRSLVQDWIKGGLVACAGIAPRASQKVKAGQVYCVTFPPLQPAIPKPDPSIPIAVVYEDGHLLVLDKPRGLTVHPGAGAPDGTLVNGLLAHCRDLSGIHGVERPGIVHRLDKDTSGLMVVAKNDATHADLARQFAERSVTKIYRALVHGVPQESGIITQPIGRHPSERIKMAVRRGGREARTDFRLLEAYGADYALVELHLHTGRTHQIRVHLTWMGFPLLGDLVYGKRANPWNLQGQALHCCHLGFVHPATGMRLEFNSEFPKVLGDIVADLRQSYGADGRA